MNAGPSLLGSASKPTTLSATTPSAGTGAGLSWVSKCLTVISNEAALVL